jgi:hypothetical protein
MHKRNKKTRNIALMAAMAVGVVLPPTAEAASPYQRERGLFGRGGTRDSGVEVGSGVLNQGFGGTSGALGNQGFGETGGGLTNQTFQEVPLGCGLLVLAAAGAGYATIKKRNKKTKPQKHNTK